MEKIRISAVNYLNTKPFIFGLNSCGLHKEISLQMDYPSECARKLLNNEVDLGLIPVAVIPEMNEYHIISDFCIGASGPVKSVKLFSNEPINQLKSVYLDYQSKTSNYLLQILIHKHWKLNVDFIMGKNGYERQIKGKRGGLIIGDRAIKFNKIFPYQYDLAEEWIKMTKLPFVFAVWVSNKILPPDFEKKFNMSLAYGVGHLKDVIDKETLKYTVDIDIEAYLLNCIDFKLDALKKKAIQLFLKNIREMELELVSN